MQQPWEFDPLNHRRHYGLSTEQCLSAFPLLYKEVDRAVAYRRAVGNITLQDVDVGWRGDGIVRAMIYDNELYIIDPHGVGDHNHRPRSIATLHSLHRAVTAYQGELPNIEFTLTDHDAAEFGNKGESHTTWAYSRLKSQESLWLMPDFGFWGWPDVGLRSYSELQRHLDHGELEWADKEAKLVWRGSLAVGAHDARNGLMTHSDGKPWSAVQSLDWGNKSNIDERLLSMEEHCDYRFVAQTEGNTYSGRLKYLLNCHSVLISHPLAWIEHFHHLLQPSGPEQNYVQVKRDFSDLPRKMKNLLKYANQDRAEAIADNARQTFRHRYLTPAAEACYWRALIRGWAEVQGFKVEYWKEVEGIDKKDGKMKMLQKSRGAPFESYTVMEAVEWDIPAKPRHMCEG